MEFELFLSFSLSLSLSRTDNGAAVCTALAGLRLGQIYRTFSHNALPLRFAQF